MFEYDVILVEFCVNCVYGGLEFFLVGFVVV